MKHRLTIWSVALGAFLLGACVASVAPSVVAANANAGQRCDYTFLQDMGDPELGEGGKVEYDSDWKSLLDGGWALKMQRAHGRAAGASLLAAASLNWLGAGPKSIRAHRRPCLSAG